MRGGTPRINTRSFIIRSPKATKYNCGSKTPAAGLIHMFFEIALFLKVPVHLVRVADY